MDQGPAYAALKPGSMFAWVAIGPELGRGPTGTVYRAQHARLDRICAIKVIAPDLSRDPEFRERFLRASRRAGSFEHAHVVRLYDIGEDNGLLYLAMEFVDGRDLGRLVDWRGPLAPESAVAIVTPVAEALQAAHDLGLVHGNVKPANILVSNAGARVYLSDLALGPVITAAYTRRLSESGDAPSPYLAPEQLLGDPIDRRADVYALGRVVQYALTAEIEGPDVPAALQPVLRIATARDPDQRYPSSAVFLEELRTAVAREQRGPAATAASPELDQPHPDGPPRPHADVLDDDVQFTVYRPHRVRPGRWYPLVAFAHKSEPFVDEFLGPVDPLELVRRQAAARLGDELDQYAPTSEDSSRDLPPGSTLTFVPQVEGVEFNPRSRSFQWLEPVHTEEFRMRASSSLDGQRARGTMSVYFGSIIIAEVHLSIRVGGREPETGAGADHARPFRRIFVSYSHRDAAVVEQVATFLSTTGDEFVRDIRDLHAGEVWEDRITDMIGSADIFQLYWSSNSMRSEFVRREWMYALSLGRQYFVRPTFWEQPMPELPELNLPPEELRRLHFFYLPGVLPTADKAPVHQAPAEASPSAASAQATVEEEPRAAPEPVAEPEPEPAWEPELLASPAPPAPLPAPAAGAGRTRSLRTRTVAVLLPVAAAIGVAIPVVASSLGGAGAPTTSAASSSGGSSEPTSTTVLGPFPCGPGVCYRGVGPAALGTISGTRGATLRWTSAGGRFVLKLDTVVAVNSSAPVGRVRLTRPRYRSASVGARDAWTIFITRVS